jgi:hypothetical protein
MYGQFAVQDQVRAQQSAQPYGRPEYDAHAFLQKHHPYQVSSQHAYPFQYPQHAYPFQHPQHAYPFQQPYQHPYSYQQPMPANHAAMQQDGSPQSATNESTINEGAMNAELQYVSNAPVHSEKPRALFPLTLATGRLR